MSEEQLQKDLEKALSNSGFNSLAKTPDIIQQQIYSLLDAFKIKQELNPDINANSILEIGDSDVYDDDFLFNVCTSIASALGQSTGNGVWLGQFVYYFVVTWEAERGHERLDTLNSVCMYVQMLSMAQEEQEAQVELLEEESDDKIIH